MADLRMMMQDALQQDADIQREIAQRQQELQRLAELLLINRGRIDVLRQLGAEAPVAAPVEYVVEAAPQEE